MPEEPELLTPPRIRIVDTNSSIDEALAGIDLANNYVIELYDWQADIVLSWLGLDQEYKYSHPTCVLIVPRQNGKTKGIIVARMLIGLILYGEKIRYSAHRVDTMLEVWEIFLNIFGDPRLSEWEYPELHALVERFTLTNGHYGIKLKNGGSISFVSRSTGSGRGNTVDVNVYDEAQYLTEAQLSSALPSQSAAPSGNPQVIYVGTPPDGIECTGEVFGRVRENAIKGVDGISLHEWSVAEIGDVSDKRRWYETNPALGLSLLESAVQNEFNNMSEEKFALERLAYWASKDALKSIKDEDWEATIDNEISNSDGFDDLYDKYCIGIKFAPNLAQISVSLGVRLKDGTTYCELIHNQTQSNSLVEVINMMKDMKDKISLIAIDGKSGADELKERLCRGRDGFNENNVVVMSTREVVTAATMLNSSLEEKTIKHAAGKVIDESAKTSTRRKIGTDGYGFGGNSIPLESFSFANWAARTTKVRAQSERIQMKVL